MGISFNQETFKKTFLNSKGDFIHKQGRHIRLFPFVTNDHNKDVILKELKDFSGVAGEAMRLSIGQKLPASFSRDTLINNVLEKVNTDNPRPLEKILKTVCFDTNGNMFRFSKKSLLYQQTQAAQKTLSNFSEYLVDIFLDDVEFCFEEKDSEVVLYKLLSEVTPELVESPKRLGCSYRGFKKIKEIFVRDLNTLKENDQLLINNFEKLLKYYLYFYMTQLSFRLEQTFEETDKCLLMPLFYSMDSEPLSESREAFLYGFKSVQKKIGELFSHAICLELLHCIDGISIKRYTYHELKEYILGLSEGENKELLTAVDDLYLLYTESVTDQRQHWDEFENGYEGLEFQEPVFNSIHKLLEAVKFQFINSSRHRAQDGYGKWLTEFGQHNFGKRRGRLGHTHALSQDYILLFVRLCIGDSKNGKLRLSDLWESLQARGLYFDQYTRYEIISFLDKNNMLEKKSDSGDAQYVAVQE